MKYSKYLSLILKTKGVPHFSVQAFAAIMNVVHCEGGISAAEKMKKHEKNPSLAHKYDLIIFDYQQKIKELTRGHEPTDFINILLQE